MCECHPRPRRGKVQLFNKKKKVIDHVFHAVQPIIATMQITSGTPSSFWSDDYILGFIGSTMIFHLTKTSPIKLKETDYGEVMTRCFEKLSLQNGLPIARKFFDFYKNADKAPERFNEGADNALLIICIIFGMPLRPDAQAKVDTIRQEIGSVEDEQFQALLMKRFFNDEAKKLF